MRKQCLWVTFKDGEKILCFFDEETQERGVESVELTEYSDYEVPGARQVRIKDILKDGENG